MIKIAIVLSSALMLINADEAYDTSIKLEKPENEGRSLQVLSDLKYVFHAYQECSSNDVTTCLKLKLLKTMDRIARSDKELQLSDGISFIKDISNKQETSNDINVDDAINNLPRSSGEKNEVLDNLLFHKTMNYFKGHILQVKFPSLNQFEQSSEARGGGGYGGIGGNKGGGFGKNKDKKNGHWIMIPLLLGSTLVPLAFGALALLAGKALIVSKLALALASIIGIKKLLSGSGHHHEAAHEVVVSGGHGSGWGRIGNFGAQGLSYNAYNP